jgi:hypothetical protein
MRLISRDVGDRDNCSAAALMAKPVSCSAGGSATGLSAEGSVVEDGRAVEGSALEIGSAAEGGVLERRRPTEGSVPEKWAWWLKAASRNRVAPPKVALPKIYLNGHTPWSVIGLSSVH